MYLIRILSFKPIETKEGGDWEFTAVPDGAATSCGEALGLFHRGGVNYI